MLVKPGLIQRLTILEVKDVASHDWRESLQYLQCVFGQWNIPRFRVLGVTAAHAQIAEAGVQSRVRFDNLVGQALVGQALCFRLPNICY